MQTFKQYFTEEQELLSEAATTASTLFEGVLVDCWNLAAKYNMRSKWESLNSADQKKFIKEIINMDNTKAFLSKVTKDFAVVGATEEQQGKIFWHLARLCRRKIKGVSGKAVGAGTKKLKLSTFWSSDPELGGTGKAVDTSKADILIGKIGISVKAPSANIMSGKANEGKATVVAALQDASGATTALKNELLGYLNQFVTDANTIGADMTGEAIKTAELKPKDMKAQEGQTESNAEIQAKLVKAGDVFKDDCEDAFNTAFKDKSISRGFALEAMTGREKFAGAVFGGAGAKEGEATHMLVWDYGMEKLKFYAAVDKVDAVASQLKMAATLKSSHRSKGGSKIGYSIYQSMRLAINTAMEDADKLVSQRNEQIERAGNLLAEGMISEFSFLDSLKKAWNWFKDKIIAVWNWLKEQWNKIKEKLIEIWEDGVGAVMSHFETDVAVTVSTNIRL